MLWHFVKQDFVERYSGSILGTVWLFASPLVQILIFTLVFGNIIGPRVGSGQGAFPYGFYLVSGVLPWTAFASTVARTSTAFIDKAGVITKVAVGLRTVAVQFSIVEGLVLAVVMTLFLAVKTLMGSPPSPLALFVPLLIVFQQVLAFAIGLAGAILTVFVRDVREVIGLVMMIWFWLTPIVYLVTDVHPALQAFQRANPAFWFIDQYHRVLVAGQMPNFAALAAQGTLVLLIIAVLFWVLSRTERDIRDFL